MNPAPIALHALNLSVAALQAPPGSRAALLDTSNASWIAGFEHPVLDAANFLGLLAIGFAAGQLGGRSRWGLFLMLAALLAFGLVLGTEGAIVPASDTIILTTGLCLGLLILGRVHLAFAIVASIGGAFALFHGIADGIDLVREKSDLHYAFGYGFGTAVGYAIGLGFGLWTYRFLHPWWSHLNDLLARYHLPHAPHSA